MFMPRRGGLTVFGSTPSIRPTWWLLRVGFNVSF